MMGPARDLFPPTAVFVGVQLCKDLNPPPQALETRAGVPQYGATACWEVSWLGAELGAE